jgi:hypothetical protein
MSRKDEYVNVPLSLPLRLLPSSLFFPYMHLYSTCFGVSRACFVLMGRCHCGGCQAFTSSAFSIGLVVPAESFELSDPSRLLKTYEDADPITLAGNRIAFCGKCGCYLMHEPVSPLLYTSETLPVFLSFTFVEGIAIRYLGGGVVNDRRRKRGV